MIAQCCGGFLLVRLPFLAYCPGMARDSPYSMATAKVRKASRPRGASSPSPGGAPGCITGKGLAWGSCHCEGWGRCRWLWPGAQWL